MIDQLQTAPPDSRTAWLQRVEAIHGPEGLDSSGPADGQGPDQTESIPSAAARAWNVPEERTLSTGQRVIVEELRVRQIKRLLASKEFRGLGGKELDVAALMPLVESLLINHMVQFEPGKEPEDRMGWWEDLRSSDAFVLIEDALERLDLAKIVAIIKSFTGKVRGLGL
jgi:hypothetical protein